MTLTRYSRILLGFFILAATLAVIFQSAPLLLGFIVGHIICRLWFGGPDYLEPRTDAITTSKG